MESTKNKNKGPITWTDEARKAFKSIKEICAEDLMLYYSDFNNVFDIQTNRSEYQVGELISQNERLVSY